MKAVEIITLAIVVLTLGGLGYLRYETFQKLQRLHNLVADVGAHSYESILDSRRELEKGQAALAEALNILGNEQLNQHQNMATHSEDQHEESLRLLGELLALVKSQAAELTEHANQLTVHAKEIIDARHQDQGNVVIPRMICSICTRVVYRWGMHEEKPVCQDCINAGRHLPPPPPPKQRVPAQRRT